MTGLLFAALAVLVAAAGILARRRLREETRSGLSDELIRQIEATGRIEAEEVEPVDLEEARAEEDAFWAQTWDEPEEL